MILYCCSFYERNNLFRISRNLFVYKWRSGETIVSRKNPKVKEITKIEFQFLQSDINHALKKACSWWNLPTGFLTSVGRIIVTIFLCQMPEKPKGFHWSQSSRIFHFKRDWSLNLSGAFRRPLRSKWRPDLKFTRNSA